MQIPTFIIIHLPYMYVFKYILYHCAKHKRVKGYCNAFAVADYKCTRQLELFVFLIIRLLERANMKNFLNIIYFNKMCVLFKMKIYKQVQM